MIPTIRAAVTELFGMAPRYGVDPDEAVALGAAIHMMDGQLVAAKRVPAPVIRSCGEESRDEVATYEQRGIPEHLARLGIGKARGYRVETGDELGGRLLELGHGRSSQDGIRPVPRA